MLCQQLLFNETSIVPDSWWLSNRQLQRVLHGSDLARGIKEGYLVVALGEKYSNTGLCGRFHDQLALPENKRLAGLITGPEQQAFLEDIDTVGAFVFYDGSQLGEFFSNLIAFIVDSPVALKSFGLLHVQAAIRETVETKRAAKQTVSASDLFNLFSEDEVLQDRAMAMSPIYVINAPLNYGYHIALAGDEKDRLYASILQLLQGLSTTVQPNQLFELRDVEDLCTPLKIDDPVFREAGLLTFDEIAGARAVHFRPFKDAFVSYCEGKIGQARLEDAYKSYQSNLRDHLAQRNARFDIILAKTLRAAATSSGYVGKVAGPYGSYEALKAGLSADEAFLIGTGVGVIAHFVQRALEGLATNQLGDARSRGDAKLLTRLDVWMGNRRAIEDGRVLH